jgi:C4-type Zn-finger protein
MKDADLTELKDCPKCGGGMKLAERPFSLPYADKELLPSNDGITIYPYVCVNCWYVELYTNPSAETLRQKPPL